MEEPAVPAPDREGVDWGRFVSRREPHTFNPYRPRTWLTTPMPTGIRIPSLHTTGGVLPPFGAACRKWTQGTGVLVHKNASAPADDDVEAASTAERGKDS